MDIKELPVVLFSQVETQKNPLSTWHHVFDMNKAKCLSLKSKTVKEVEKNCNEKAKPLWQRVDLAI